MIRTTCVRRFSPAFELDAYSANENPEKVAAAARGDFWEVVTRDGGNSVTTYHRTEEAATAAAARWMTRSEPRRPPWARVVVALIFVSTVVGLMHTPPQWTLPVVAGGLLASAIVRRHTRY